MTVKRKNPEDFETALARLEDITEKLEAGEVKLDEAITLYTKGIETVAYCQKQLAEVEKKILVLKEKNDQLLETSFDQDETDGS